MPRTFKHMRGCSLTYDKQGYIFFMCRNYKHMSPRVKSRIRRLCEEVGKEYSTALFQVLTTQRGVRKVALDCYVSERQLYELRKRFFESWRWTI